MQVIVLADGDVGPRAAIDLAWPGWAHRGALVVAADGGARHAAELGLPVDRWVGDGDSLGEDGIAALVAAGVPVDRARPDKDESDTELAVITACRLGATSLALVGALGGARVDHALANLALLSLPALAGLDARLVGADARIRLLRAGSELDAPVAVELDGRAGDGVSLLPVGGDADGVTTAGLRYPLHDETLREGRSRGLSNERIAARASVTLRAGRLLVIETPARL
jgi:thiamine pyrophosphokinase